MLLRTTAPALVLLGALLTGCSGDDDCAGTSYDVDPSAQGAATTIDALDAWLAAPEGVDERPPKEDWIVQGGGDPDADEVVILNESTEDGWWVRVVRTDEGGYVVDRVTDDWSSCQDELS